MVIDHPQGRSVVFLSAVPDNRNVRHSRYVGHACPSAVPYGKKGFAAHSVDIDRKRTERSIPRRRRLSLSENGNPFVRFADISPIRGISHCHFVTSPQRRAPLPYSKRCSDYVGERLAAPAAGRWTRCNVGYGDMRNVGVGALDDPHGIIISYQLMFSIQIRPPLRES